MLVKFTLADGRQVCVRADDVYQLRTSGNCTAMATELTEILYIDEPIDSVQARLNYFLAKD